MRLHLMTAGVFLLACLGMARLWPTPWIWPFLTGCLILMLAISRDPRDLAFFILGVVLGGFIDVLQTGAGVTVYSTPGPVLLFPGFVLFYWGLSGVALRHLYQLFPATRLHPADLALFGGAVGLSLFGNLAPNAMAGLMTAALAAHWLVMRRQWSLLAAVLVMGFGPLTESMLIREGLYHFPSAQGRLIAVWLYPLYACVGAALMGVYPALEALTKRLPWGRRQPSVDG